MMVDRSLSSVQALKAHEALCRDPIRSVSSSPDRRLPVSAPLTCLSLQQEVTSGSMKALGFENSRRRSIKPAAASQSSAHADVFNNSRVNGGMSLQ